MWQPDNVYNSSLRLEGAAAGGEGPRPGGRAAATGLERVPINNNIIPVSVASAGLTHTSEEGVGEGSGAGACSNIICRGWALLAGGEEGGGGVLVSVLLLRAWPKVLSNRRRRASERGLRECSSAAGAAP